MRAWLPVLAMCFVIFLFSKDAHSLEHSDRLLSWLLSLFGLFTPHRVEVLSIPFRKFAHVTVYFCLSAVTYRAFALHRGTGFNSTAAWRAIVFCGLYAATDEIHQMFVPTRTPAVHDVIIDIGGALLSLACIRWALGPGNRTPIDSDVAEQHEPVLSASE